MKNKKTITVYGPGASVENQEKLFESCWEKSLIDDIIEQLITYTKDCSSSKMLSHYEVASNCRSTLIVTDDNKCFGRNCKTRFCYYCNRVEQYKRINEYLPIIEKWKDLFMVTLTIEGVENKELKKTICEMLRQFKAIIDKYNKRYRKLLGCGDILAHDEPIKLLGIRFSECTFSIDINRYKPHFHILVPSENIADILIHEWRERNKGKLYKGAQHKQKISKSNNSIINTIKYCIKPMPIEEFKSESKLVIVIPAIHHILSCYEGKQRINKFGFKSSPKKNIKTKIELEDFTLYRFFRKIRNWKNKEANDSLFKKDFIRNDPSDIFIYKYNFG